MKYVLIAGALVLGLAACGKKETVTPNPNPVVEGAYNPDASATESMDPRVPYVGDWAWVAKLPDNSYRQGTLTIDERGTPNDSAKNGGVGENAVCADDTCATPSGSDFAVILTQVTNSGPQLAAFLGDSAGDSNRLTVTDSDGKVTLNTQGRPVISGNGRWAETQDARVAFVQVDATPDGTVLPDAFVQARAAADAVTAQRVQALPALDLDSVLK